MGGRSERKSCERPRCGGMLVAFTRPAWIHKHFPKRRDRGTDGRFPTPRAAIAQSFRNPYGRPGASMPRGDAVKGVGKFGEVMAGEKGKAEYGASLEKLHRVVHSGSQPKAILDFLVRELRRGFPL